ncbi:MAG: GNAT family N-acetyltransferase [Nitrospirae bacterium]|nr:GNAT family N-acetyltransferase [Nitrospirota bacterium]
MAHGLDKTTIYKYPSSFVNKKNEPILVKILDENWRSRLINMYLSYKPRNSFSGLPPLSDESCLKWVDNLINSGINLIAISFENGLIGNAVLLPMKKEMAELLVVVKPEYQNIGVGTQLTRNIVQLAYEMGYDRVWLTVERGNNRARHVYLKCGFEYINAGEFDEHEMALEVGFYRKIMSVPIGSIMNRNVIKISEVTTCKQAIDLFLKYNISALPVVNEKEEVTGLLSETDLLIETNYAMMVKDISTRSVISVEDDCHVSTALRLFQLKNLRCLPVLDADKRLIGIVGRKDILAYMKTIFG